MTRRRYLRRRRNPSLDVKGVAFGAVAGAGIAAIAYALDGVPQLSNRNRALALLGGGLVGGMLVSMVSPAVGAGLAAGGVAIGGHSLIGTMTSGAPEKPETTTTQPPATTAGLGALRSELGALRSELGAIRGELGEYQPDDAMAPAGLGAVREYDYTIG